jgi:DNA polymerase V
MAKKRNPPKKPSARPPASSPEAAERKATDLRGTPSIKLELMPTPRKSLVVSRMFGRKLAEFEPVKQALVAYITRAAEKLFAGHMQIFLHHGRFAATELYAGYAAGVCPPHATSDSAELIRHGAAAVRRAYRRPALRQVRRHADRSHPGTHPPD